MAKRNRWTALIVAIKRRAIGRCRVTAALIAFSGIEAIIILITEGGMGIGGGASA